MTTRLPRLLGAMGHHHETIAMGHPVRDRPALRRETRETTLILPCLRVHLLVIIMTIVETIVGLPLPGLRLHCLLATMAHLRGLITPSTTLEATVALPRRLLVWGREMGTTDLPMIDVALRRLVLCHTRLLQDLARLLALHVVVMIMIALRLQGSNRRFLSQCLGLWLFALFVD